MKKMNDLLPKSEGSKSHFWYTDREGRLWSVVDLEALMSGGPTPLETYRHLGMFLGWEAMVATPDGGVASDTQLRAATWSELQSLIEPVTVNGAVISSEMQGGI